MGRSNDVVKDGGEIPAKDVSEFDEVVQSGYDVMIAARSLLKRINGLVSELEKGKGTIGKLLTERELYDRLNSISGRVDSVVAGLGTNQGTAGRLLNDQQLYDNMNRAVTELRDLLSDIRKDPKKFLRVSVSIF